MRAVAMGALYVALTACGRHGIAVAEAGSAALPVAVSMQDAGAPHDASLAGRPAAESASGLARDVKTRAAAARARFGGARIETVGGIFVLAEIGTHSALFDKAVALMARAIPPLYHGRFTKRPDQGVTALFFASKAAYVAYSHERFPDAGVNLGFYQPAVREIAVDVSQGESFLTSFTHEMVHPFIEADFPDAPLWFNEGIASLFEAPEFGEEGEIHGASRNWRDVDFLQPAFASASERKDLRVDALFGMPRRVFLGDPRHVGVERAGEAAGVHYALARSVCGWLDAQGKLWPFYQAWRDGFEEDETGERAFQRVMEGTPREMNGKWLAWAR